MPTDDGLDFSALRDIAVLVACAFATQDAPFHKPLPAWWPYTWCRRTLGPDGIWSLEVSEAEERPW